MKRPLAQRPHWVYRCYDAEGVLLYIGVTCNLKARFRNHAHPSKYVQQFPAGTLHERMARYTAECYPNRAEAFKAERAATAAEQPVMNVMNRQAAIA